jgi:Sulfotransferase family
MPERPHRRPDFFVVGHPKCGTSALFGMLARHPQIFMPRLKEPGVFLPEVRERAQPGKRPRTVDEYLELFSEAAPEQRAGDATPWYLHLPTAPEEIASLRPDARIVAIFREPASFLVSLHGQQLRDHRETEPDLRRALALEDERKRGINIPASSKRRPYYLFYSEYVQYAAQLERYHAHFSREQVLVLTYDEFRSDNQGTLATICRFLGVDDAIEIPAAVVNPALEVRALGLHRLTHGIAMGETASARRVRGLIKAVVPRRARHRAVSVQKKASLRRPRPTDQELVADLRRDFAHEVHALSEYLDRDFASLWGYSR